MTSALYVRGGLVRLSQTIDPICPTEHDREEDEIDRCENVDAWWWAGLKFDDLLRAYPPMSQAKWARLESSVNLGPWGNPDP
jgi:hypothetical protein